MTIKFTITVVCILCGQKANFLSFVTIEIPNSGGYCFKSIESSLTGDAFVTVIFSFGQRKNMVIFVRSYVGKSFLLN